MKIAITGGAGYVGSALVPYLTGQGHQVTVVDLFWYGRGVLSGSGASLVEVDIRDQPALASALRGHDAIIHLACISNDPSFELDPQLGKSINYDAFPGLLEAVRCSGASRFIYASSSSVYGLSDKPEVDEETECRPLTDYSRFKLDCESLLHERGVGDTVYTIIRPATVCGYAPRLRLDLVVNILTINALVHRKIRVFGGPQLRPNIHIQDMVRAYELLLLAPEEKVRGQAFNAGYENRSLTEIATLVAETLEDPGLEIVHEETDDLRSYHISSKKIARELGFEASFTLKDAIAELARRYRSGEIPEPMTNPLYFNIKTMKEVVAL
ncbi:MAG: SDR family oxidoreductase [Vulcanimicrobiota bacterium]